MQNIVILAGNIGQTPEVRTTQGGTKITNFSLATSRPRISEGRVLRDDNGYRVMDTEWHRITCFNGLGKTVAEHCEKGMKVLVHGRIHYTKWIDSMGNDRYGRIHDHELVEAVQRIAGNGTGDTRWKVPGVLDWSTGVYNPDVEISRDTTTLYASDRDVFLFLVDDRNPIEAGKLPDGSPDLYFRGFYCWNSEVGAKTLGMASFYLRAVCQNRNLWGVEDFQEIRIRHSKYAASRFAHEAAPALTRFGNSSPQGFVNGIKAARQQIVARTDEDRDEFLRKRGFSRAESGKIIEKVLMEEGRPPESIFDFVQGITRLARDKTQQDARLDMEGRAKKLLDRVG